jgi:hypothetical protein
MNSVANRQTSVSLAWIPASRLGDQREAVLADSRELVLWQSLFQSLISGDDAFEEADLLEVQERLELGERVGTISPRKKPRFEIDLTEPSEVYLHPLPPIPTGSDLTEVSDIVVDA